MPIAKKNKVVSLTQVKPKTRDHKQAIVQRVHTYLQRFKYTYVLTFENMTTNNFKALKQTLTQSKFLMGKNKVMGVAFGNDQQTSFKPNLYKLTQYLKGHCVLFFTNMPPAQCQQIFENFSAEQFATGGTVGTETIILQQGFQSLKKFSHSIEPYLRQLGLPTRLVNSQIELTSDFIASQEGKPLTVNQCKLLKLIGNKMSRLKFQIKGWYDGKKVHL